MNERDSWSDLQEGRMRSSAARAAYEHARSACELGQMVRELREERGLSQRELAERMGTTQSVVGRLEAGGSTPTITTLERIADALGLRLELRFRPPDPTRSSSDRAGTERLQARLTGDPTSTRLASTTTSRRGGSR
jgi:transcriptional regulator with XRE-family HTH domain